MAKWFRDFPINLKNGNERVRSASESGPQTRPKPSFSRDSLKGNQRKDGGVGGLLAGRNRKNSATELGRSNAVSIGTVWDSLAPGKGRKNSKIESGPPDENRQVRTSSLAQAYISRMIKVDKQDKTPKLNGICEQKVPENEKGRSDIKTTVSECECEPANAIDMHQLMIFTFYSVVLDLESNRDRTSYCSIFIE